jgi:hypothetical protein
MLDPRIRADHFNIVVACMDSPSANTRCAIDRILRLFINVHEPRIVVRVVCRGIIPA